MRIAIGADKIGAELKDLVCQRLLEWGYEVEDYTPPPESTWDYPEVAEAVALSIAAGKHPRGILICGTGIGMAIVANKVPGVRAALCHDVYSAERARLSNDAQILTMGARVIGPELASTIVRRWLECDFEGEKSRSFSKVGKMIQVDQKYRHA